MANKVAQLEINTQGEGVTTIVINGRQLLVPKEMSDRIIAELGHGDPMLAAATVNNSPEIRAVVNEHIGRGHFNNLKITDGGFWEQVDQEEQVRAIKRAAVDATKAQLLASGRYARRNK